MTAPELHLRNYLEGARDFAGKLPTEYHYRNLYDFVLREGLFFEPQMKFSNNLKLSSPPNLRRSMPGFNA